MLELMMGLMRSGGGSPGDELVAGTLEHGWYGEIPASDFITPLDLTALVGLTDGNAINLDSNWLKFSLDQKTLYVAKRPIRNNITWDQLNALGLVFGTKTISINGRNYKVRLLKGRGDGLSTDPKWGSDILPTHGSEWNRLMYHIAATLNGGAMTSEGIVTGDWAQYTNVDLGNGGNIFCQETFIYQPGNSKQAIFRFYQNITGLYYYTVNIPNNSNRWLPCLELIE